MKTFLRILYLSKLRKVLHCNKHYFLYILMQKLLLYDFPIKSYRMLNITSMISFKITSQKFGLSKIVICVYFYGPIKYKMFHNTSFLPHFHWKKCFSWLCLAWWRLRKNMSKMKNSILAHYFLPLTQNQLYRKEPHLVMLGHKWWYVMCHKNLAWWILYVDSCVSPYERKLEICQNIAGPVTTFSKLFTPSEVMKNFVNCSESNLLEWIGLLSISFMSIDMSEAKCTTYR